SGGLIASMKQGSRVTSYFLNYYDTQRFGVPGGPKQTHRVGEALVAGDLDLAFEYLAQSGSPQGQRAAIFPVPGQSFFRELEPRVIDFYKSSYASYLWNRRLASLVLEVCGEDVYECSVDNIPFLLTHRQDRVLAVLERKPFLEYTRS